MKNRQSTKKRTSVNRNNLLTHLPNSYAWKVLGKLTEDLGHLLTDSERKQVYDIVRSKDYEAYLSLSQEWGVQSIVTTGMSSAEMRAKYQIVSLIKKYRFPSEDAMRRQAALDKFKEGEKSCEHFNREGYRDLAWIEDDRMCNAYTYARTFLSKLLGHELPSSDKLTLWSRHGPGANLDTKNGGISQYYKYSEWPYSCTKDAVREARIAIQADERWLGALEDSYRQRMNIPMHIIISREELLTAVINVVPGNRISFVPKNSQTDRSIAIEPSLNLYLQLGIDGYIRRRLKRYGVDLDNQEKNRELARLGSLHWEDPENFVTLDLAAASDSISTSVCYYLLPRLWYNHLLALRSPCGELDGETISYEKISSMGNGFTFALESAIFTAVVYGVMKEFLGSYDPDRCAIFGDDLIVPSSIAGHVTTLLNLCGFSINAEKSFTEGPFRESCGADWYNGTPVRPVFFTTPPTTVMELWTDLNRLRRILSLRFMVEDSKVEKLMVSWIPAEFAGVTGPCSDTTFDSYRHVNDPPKGGYVNYVWEYRTLTVRSKPVSEPSFFFRKLMHDLRGGSPVEPLYKTRHGTWRGAKLTGNGSRFTITRPNRVMVGYSYSCTSHWCKQYAESSLGWEPRGSR